MVLSVMTKAVLATTDRRIGAQIQCLLRLTDSFGTQRQCLLRLMYFLSVGFGRPTAMLAKTSRHVECVFIFRWDLGHNGDAC